METDFRTVRLGAVDYAELKVRVAEYEALGWSVYGQAQIFGQTTLRMGPATPFLRDWRRQERERAGLPAPEPDRIGGICVGCTAAQRGIPHGPHGYAVSGPVTAGRPGEAVGEPTPAAHRSLPLHPTPAQAAQFWFGV